MGRFVGFGRNHNETVDDNISPRLRRGLIKVRV